MLEFPAYYFAISGSWLRAAGMIGIVLSYYGRFGEGNYNFMASATAALCFVLAGLFSTYLNVTYTYRFRNLNASEIVGLKVAQSGGESESRNLAPKILADPAIIRAGLNSLKSCRETTRHHEKYTDGYKINLLFNDNLGGSVYFLSVYRKSSGSDVESVVIPHFSETSSNSNLGEYDCPGFQKWVELNVEPLFQKEKGSLKQL